MRRGLLLLLVCACLIVPGAPASSGSAAGRARALRWADRRYREAVAGAWHSSGYRDSYARLQFNDVALAYEHVRYRYGPSLGEELGLARSLEQLCSFSEAAAAYRAVLRFEPLHREAREGLRRTGLLARAARKIRAGVADRTMLYALDLSAPGAPPSWLLASAVGGGGPGAVFEDTRLHQVSERSTQLIWTAGDLEGPGESTPDPIYGRGVGAVEGQEIYLRRLSPRGRPLIFALVGESPMAGTADTQVIVFRLAGKKLERIWAIAGTVGATFPDRSGDGWLEIGIQDEVGFDLFHAAQPRWMDLYGWDGQGYRSVNHRYRGTFREVGRQIREVQEIGPADPDLVAHLGQLHEMYGRRRAAIYAYRWAIAECGRRLQQDNAADVRVLLRDARARLQKLERQPALEPRGANN